MVEAEGEEEVVNLILDDDVSVALCRRGKLKLRGIEASSEALLTMDSTKKGLEIRGSPECVADARRKIENLSGIKLETRPTVWAELMRTRTTSDPAFSAIASIQDTSGCRIHVKRDSTQIQLFGPKDKTHMAAQLIDLLDSMCGELSVGMNGNMSEDRLHVLAREFGVTLVEEKGHINILGIKGAIAEAVRDLLLWDQEADAESDFDWNTDPAVSGRQRRSEIAQAAIQKAISELKNAIVAPFKPSSFTSASCAAGSDVTTEEGRSVTEGSQDTDAHDFSNGPCSACGVFAFCGQCGKRAEKMELIHKGTCTKCFISKFCVYCGCEFVRQTLSTDPA